MAKKTLTTQLIGKTVRVHCHNRMIFDGIFEGRDKNFISLGPRRKFQ
jgi:hypothetical protein